MDNHVRVELRDYIHHIVTIQDIEPLETLHSDHFEAYMRGATKAPTAQIQAAIDDMWMLFDQGQRWCIMQERERNDTIFRE